MKAKLFGKTLEELEHIVDTFNVKKYVAKQIAHWLYVKQINHIAQMSNLSKVIREELSEHYDVGLSTFKSVQASMDGTKKYLFAVDETYFVETALIPDQKRATLCVSSQVGCKYGCIFCLTGNQGFQKQLTTSDILNQICSLPEKNEITNIVFMGMGEPFDNLENVIKAVNILTADWGFAMSPKRITVSSVGIIPGIKKFLEETKAHLAISLHSPFTAERLKLMPIEKKYTIHEILQVIRSFNVRGQRRISFEYILFKGLNDSVAHVNELVRILHGIQCKVNLIKFHPVLNSSLQSPCENVIEWFRDCLKSKGIMTTIRRSRGQDINAACGMLSTKNFLDSKLVL